MATLTLDEMIANAEASAEKAQKKVADLKAKKKKIEDKKIMKIGQAVAGRFPEILEMMDGEGFNIFEFVKTKEFANLVWHQYKQDEEKANAETVQREIPQAQTQGVYQNIQQ